MKLEFVFRMILLRLLIGSLGVAATCTLLFAQERTESDTKHRLSVGVLIDTSAHQKKVIEFEREVVNSIADGFVGVATETFVVRYADEVELLQDWSPLGARLRTVSPRIELDAQSGKNQRTLLYEALNAGLLKLDTGNVANSRVLIIIGEGNNAGGGVKYSQIKKLAKSAHVQCFVLLVADHNLIGGRVRHFGFDLYDLASATKGKAYDIERSRKSLDKAIRDVVRREFTRAERETLARPFPGEHVRSLRLSKMRRGSRSEVPESVAQWTFIFLAASGRQVQSGVVGFGGSIPARMLGWRRWHYRWRA